MVTEKATFISIENADATPPHLEVTLHLGSCNGVQGSCQFFAFGCSIDFCELYLCACVLSQEP